MNHVKRSMNSFWKSNMMVPFFLTCVKGLKWTRSSRPPITSRQYPDPPHIVA